MTTPIRIFMLLLVIASLLSSAIFLYKLRSEFSEIRDLRSGGPLWIVNQLEFELLRFRADASDYLSEEGEISCDELALSLDILWSRLNISEQQGIEKKLGGGTILSEIRSALLRIDSAGLDNRDVLSKSVAELSALEPRLHDLVLEYKAMDSDQFNAAQTSLVSVSGYTLILSAVLAISSIIIIVIYSVESRIQRQAFREKQKLIRRLDEAYKMKSEFLSVVSHELRTPLTSILGALKLLASGRLGDVPEQVQRPLDIVHRNSQRLSALVNDILDFEKIESGNLSYNMGVVNVDSLVASAVEAGSLLGCSRGINVRVDNLSTGATVYGDENRLAQLLSNLISNAVKFSPDNSTVNVDVTHEDKVQISVTDEGPGIPESFENKVFERFTQAETGSARKFSGTGIGLNIAMAIAVAHKGKLFFKSKVGSGTTFFLELPQHGNLG